MQSPNSESALPVGDERQQIRRTNCFSQVAVNTMNIVELQVARGRKYEESILKYYDLENKNHGCNILFYMAKLFHCFGVQDLDDILAKR